MEHFSGQKQAIETVKLPVWNTGSLTRLSWYGHDSQEAGLENETDVFKPCVILFPGVEVLFPYPEILDET